MRRRDNLHKPQADSELFATPNRKKGLVRALRNDKNLEIKTRVNFLESEG